MPSGNPFDIADAIGLFEANDRPIESEIRVAVQRTARMRLQTKRFFSAPLFAREIGFDDADH
jgi:hypothetical protein